MFKTKSNKKDIKQVSNLNILQLDNNNYNNKRRLLDLNHNKSYNLVSSGDESM